MPQAVQRTQRLSKLEEQRETIASNAKYLREQQELINDTINAGNNHILQLNNEADELKAEIKRLKAEIITIRKDIDNKKFELLSLN